MNIFSQDDTDLDYQSLFAMPDADVLAQLIAMSQMNAAAAGGNKKKKGKKNKESFYIFLRKSSLIPHFFEIHMILFYENIRFANYSI